MNLAELKASILEDGVVDASEVAQLKEVLLADGVIDAEEAKLLFEINDAVSGNANDASWTDFFVSSITSHVLADEATPGVVDADEAAFLISNIQGDGVIDTTEVALLHSIKTNATLIHPSLIDLFVQASANS